MMSFTTRRFVAPTSRAPLPRTLHAPFVVRLQPGSEADRVFVRTSPHFPAKEGDAFPAVPLAVTTGRSLLCVIPFAEQLNRGFFNRVDDLHIPGTWSRARPNLRSTLHENADKPYYPIAFEYISPGRPILLPTLMPDLERGDNGPAGVRSLAIRAYVCQVGRPQSGKALLSVAAWPGCLPIIGDKAQRRNVPYGQLPQQGPRQALPSIRRQAIELISPRDYNCVELKTFRWETVLERNIF